MKILKLSWLSGRRAVSGCASHRGREFEIRIFFTGGKWNELKRTFRQHSSSSSKNAMTCSRVMQRRSASSQTMLSWKSAITHGDSKSAKGPQDSHRRQSEIARRHLGAHGDAQTCVRIELNSKYEKPTGGQPETTDCGGGGRWPGSQLTAYWILEYTVLHRGTVRGVPAVPETSPRAWVLEHRLDNASGSTRRDSGDQRGSLHCPCTDPMRPVRRYGHKKG
jgi:hypothetical protein